MDIIGSLAKFIVSFIPGGEATERIRIIASFVIYVGILIVIAFARPIAMSIPPLRSYLEVGEVYAGKYVQIIGTGDSRRYSILDISYNAKLRTYHLRGTQYDQAGNRAIDFTSLNVAFHHEDGPMSYIEFLWQAETVADKGRFDGYTQMRIDDKSDSEMYEGRGFFVTFHNQPLRFDLRFFKITDARLQQFQAKDPHTKMKSPVTEQDRHDFVARLHKVLAAHPSLQPLEESGRPVL